MREIASLGAGIAVDRLRRGGNAVDAAIAGVVLLGVCEPQMTGLGVACFALVKPAGSEDAVALNGSGRAPGAAFADAMRAGGAKSGPVGSAAAVTVPGAVDAFRALSDRYGRLGLADSLGGVIDCFEAGVPVAQRVAFNWAEARATLQGCVRDIYLPDGHSPRPETRFALTGPAEALRRIARDGRAGFYDGEIADDIIASLRRAGGVHEGADFPAIACEWDAPVSGDGRGTELLEHLPNSQGATAILMAAILSRFDITAIDPLGAKRAHLEAEAVKLAADARDRFLADPDLTSRLVHTLAPSPAG